VYFLALGRLKLLRLGVDYPVLYTKPVVVRGPHDLYAICAEIGPTCREPVIETTPPQRHCRVTRKAQRDWETPSLPIARPRLDNNEILLYLCKHIMQTTLEISGLCIRIASGGDRLVGGDDHIHRYVIRAYRDFTHGQHLFSQSQCDYRKKNGVMKMRSSEPCKA
jgi:hypothetical protein